MFSFNVAVQLNLAFISVLFLLFRAYQRRTPAASGGIRQDGNIARLGGDDDDSDDETNTYNGNSTQQM